MTHKDIEKTFDSFITWLKSMRKSIEVETIETKYAKSKYGVRILDDNRLWLIGFGDSEAEAMHDVLEDAIINYELEEINRCSSVEELALRLAVMGF